MGKRIPKSKKHKKLKFVDPCYNGPAPLSRKKKLLFNEPPVAGDVQEVPRHMEELIELKNKAKHNKLKRRKKKKPPKDDFIIVKNTIVDNFEAEGGKKSKKVPRFVKQKKFESEHQFFNRLQKMTDTAIAEAKVEDKYNIELVNVDKKGNAEYVPAVKEVTEKKKEKRKKQKERLDEKKRLKRDNGEFDLKKESVRFGEVVSAPPTLTAKPRKAPELGKAGSRQLALKDMLSSKSQPADKKIAPLSTKWKTLSPAKRKMAENERLRAVEMYRMMKNKKTS